MNTWRGKDESNTHVDWGIRDRRDRRRGIEGLLGYYYDRWKMGRKEVRKWSNWSMGQGGRKHRLSGSIQGIREEVDIGDTKEEGREGKRREEKGEGAKQ